MTEFLEHVKELRQLWDLRARAERRGEERPLWFRGHGDAAGRLAPRLYRRQYLGSDENEIRHEFQSRALQLVQGRLPTDKWECYFLMQHYGVPTRLLDWTENVLVALYFAVVDHPDNCDAAVWALDPWWWNRRLRKHIEGPMLPGWKEADAYLPEIEAAFAGQKITASLPAAIEPPHVDRRLAAQASRFLIFGNSKDLMRTKPARKRSLRNRHVGMIRISQRAINDIRTDLEYYGITASSIFPDLSGLCWEICRKWDTG